MQLNDPSLLETRAFIGGEWVKGPNTFSVKNPANGAVIAEVTDVPLDGVRAAIDASYDSLKDWAKKTVIERAAIMRRWRELTVENADALAVILTAEMSNPLAAAPGESL